MLGRQDYTEPEPMSDSEIDAYNACEIKKVEGKKTIYSVNRGGELFGYVTTRLGGQMYKLDLDGGWSPTIGDWNKADPVHGRAVLELIKQADEIKGA